MFYKCEIGNNYTLSNCSIRLTIGFFVTRKRLVGLHALLRWAYFDRLKYPRKREEKWRFNTEIKRGIYGTTPRTERIVWPRFSGWIDAQPYSGTLSFRPRCRRTVIRRYIIPRPPSPTPVPSYPHLLSRYLPSNISQRYHIERLFLLFHLETSDILINVYGFLICAVSNAENDFETNELFLNNVI